MMDPLLLDREPLGKYEQELVNGFQEISTLEAIWVRDVPPQITGSYPIMRVYLAFSVMDAGSRHLADRIQEAYEVRHHWAAVEFKFSHIPADRIPADVPARIWKRPARVWTPSEHRVDLMRRR